MIGICFRIFTGGCKQFCTGELVFRYLEFVFSREFVFAGATFECSFCRVIGLNVLHQLHMMQLEM